MKTRLVHFAFAASYLIPAVARAEAVDFTRDVQPILAAKCFAGHGPDAKHRKANLRPDVREVAVAVGAIVAALLA